MLKEYYKFVVLFPIELLWDGINISLIRWLSSHVLYQTYHENKQCKVINENDIHIHHWHKKFSLETFMAHHAEEISYGLDVALPVYFLTLCIPSMIKNPIWEITALPVTFVSKIANHVIGIDVEKAIFPINFYELGHTTFNLYLAFEPLKDAFLNNYCIDESYLGLINEGIKSELAAPFKVVSSIFEFDSRVAKDASDFVQDTSNLLQENYDKYFSLLSHDDSPSEYQVNEL